MAERVGVAGSPRCRLRRRRPPGARRRRGSCGRVVVLPAMTFVATANAVAYGAELAFVDCRADDANVDVPLLLRPFGLFSPRARTWPRSSRSISSGVPAITPRHGRRALLRLAFHSSKMPQRRWRHPCGPSCRSFWLLSGALVQRQQDHDDIRGACCCPNDTEMIQRARYLSTQARQPVPWYEHTEIGKLPDVEPLGRCGHWATFERL